MAVSELLSQLNEKNSQNELDQILTYEYEHYYIKNDLHLLNPKKNVEQNSFSQDLSIQNSEKQKFVYQN